MANFTIDGRMRNLPDIQKQYMFELLIPNIGEWNQDDMIVRCKTASIPSRGNTPIESFFMGTKSFTPGQPIFTNVLNVEIEELEDQKGLISLYDWSQKIFDHDPNSPTGGQSQENSKQGVSRDISLRMYKGNGEPLEKSISFKNSFIENFDDSPMGFANNESVKINVTFRFDYWLLVNTNT